MKNKIQQLIVASLICIPQVYAQDLNVIVLEDFNNNNLEWDLTKESNVNTSIGNGALRLVNSSNDPITIFNELGYDIDESFTFETKFTINSIGDDGVVFLSNFVDWDSRFFGYEVSGGKAKPICYTGSGFANGGAYDSYKAISDDSFNKKGTSITLKLVCKLVDDGPYNHQEMTYYLNGQEIVTDNRSNMHESFKKFGFVVYPGTNIDVDYIHVYGTPDEVIVPNITEISSSPLGITPSGSTTIKTFVAGDNIYAKIYLPESFLDLMQGTSYKVTMSEMIYANDEKLSEFEWTMNAEAIRSQGSNYQVQISPNTSSIESPREAYSLTKKLIGLKPGIHDIKLVVVYQKVGLSMSNALGEVSFKFDNTSASGREKFRKIVAEYRSILLKSVKMPKAKMSNSTIESNVKKAIINAGWVQTPIKVVILESDWRTVTDKFYGTILQRQINVAVAVKDANGFCTIFYPSVYQEYQGNGKYSSTITLGGIHKIEQDIDCGNIN